MIATAHQISVLAAKPGPKPEPITDRLIKTLPHSDRQATVGDVRFSTDGTRFMMAGYPSGVVQLWDTAAWKETARLETTSGLRQSLRYSNPTPDWKTILVDVRTRKVVRDEKDGKVTERLQIDGRIDLYDTATGKLKDTISLRGRGPTQLFVLPDGKSAFINTEGSFTAATSRDRPQSAEIVDLTQKTTKALCDSQAYPVFTPDGRTLYLAKLKFLPNGTVSAALVKYDRATNKELKSVQPPDDQTYFDGVYLSPDGKWLVTSQRQLKAPSMAMTIRSPDTLDEVARIPGPTGADRNTYFAVPRFSADCRSMITRAGGPLLVWDLANQKIARTLPIGDLDLGHIARSPDGSRAVVVGTRKSETPAATTDLPDPPQPRVLLVDLVNPQAEPEVLILPHGYVNGVALSPDGNTLAVGSLGGVHLIDVAVRKK